MRGLRASRRCFCARTTAQRCCRRAREATIISREATRPTFAFMLRHPAHVVALGAGAGLVPRAPGTAGTLLAFPLHWWISPHFSVSVWLAILASAFGLGMWACGQTGRALGASDHGALVWDEIVAFALVLFFTPDGVFWQAGAF